MGENKFGLRLILTVIFFTLIFNVEAFATSMSVDKSKIADGIVGVKYSGDFKTQIKLTVEKDGNRYVYTVVNNKWNYVPLQMGTGSYTVALNQQISGTKYKTLGAEKVTAKTIDEKAMYTYPTMITYFNDSMNSITYFKNKNAKRTYENKVSFVYQDVVSNYSYDYDKVKNLPANYVPYIDDMYKSKKGICYDYAALMAGALRTEGIPTKLVMGYSQQVQGYHAWNEIYVNNKWIPVDTTYDATKFQAGFKVDFEKKASNFEIVKVY